MATRTKIMASGLLIVWLSAACSSGDVAAEHDADVEDYDVVEERYGALSAEFVYPRYWGGEGVEVQAQFLDVRGVSVTSALEALEVWMPDRSLDIGECQMTSGDIRSATGGNEPVSLHLLDLGDIEIESPLERVTLEPRRLPDLLSSFYGVMYGSEWTQERSDSFVEYYPGAAYRFQAPGSSQAGSFDVTLQAPEPIVLMGANGGEIRDQGSIPLTTDDGLELVWDVGTSMTSGEEIFIDLSTGYGSKQARIQCRAEDDGAFSISRSSLRELSLLSDDVDLEIRRVRRGEAEITGLDRVDFYFVTTDHVEFHFE